MGMRPIATPNPPDPPPGTNAAAPEFMEPGPADPPCLWRGPPGTAPGGLSCFWGMEDKARDFVNFNCVIFVPDLAPRSVPTCGMTSWFVEPRSRGA